MQDKYSSLTQTLGKIQFGNSWLLTTILPISIFPLIYGGFGSMVYFDSFIPLLLVIYIFVFYWFIFPKKIQNNFSKKIQDVKDAHIKLNNAFNSEDYIDTAKILYLHISNLLRLRTQLGIFFPYISRFPHAEVYKYSSRDHNEALFFQEFNIFIKEEIEWIIHYLHKKMNSQILILESAKWEVENNIHWTIELESVSELQKSRLDKQIEQFKVLQKILVKV